MKRKWMLCCAAAILLLLAAAEFLFLAAAALLVLGPDLVIGLALGAALLRLLAGKLLLLGLMGLRRCRLLRLCRFFFLVVSAAGAGRPSVRDVGAAAITVCHGIPSDHRVQSWCVFYYYMIPRRPLQERRGKNHEQKR